MNAMSMAVNPVFRRRLTFQTGEFTECGEHTDPDDGCVP